ncbi:5'-nucleotidase, lipoprotein e(P4) family [Nitrospira sp. Ecomares 2.1]
MLQQNVLRFFLLLSCLYFVGGCSTAPSGAGVMVRDSHERLNGVLWIQTSAEYEVMAQTLYVQAKLALDRSLADTSLSALEQAGNYQSLPPAIVVDIDETIFDNSPFSGRLIKERSGYDHGIWTEWAKQGAAAPIPGAVDFLRYAHRKGVTVLYVTNREYDVELATRKNLQNLGFPLTTTTDTVLTKNEPPHNWPSDKTTRRSELAKDYRILLLIGDDLGDFVSGAKSDPATRRQLAQKHKKRWGDSWFLLPNPLYGSWETSLYDKSLRDQQVLQKKIERVKGF